MFADSLCESGSNNRSRRGWITLASFGAQALAVSALLTLPFWYTQSLPQVRSLIEPIAPPSARSSDARHQRTTSSSANHTRGELLVTPPHIPNVIEIPNETKAPPAPDLPAGYGVSVWCGWSRIIESSIWFHRRRRQSDRFAATAAGRPSAASLPHNEG